MAVIVPGRNQAKIVAELLLDLADNPHDVATTMDGPDGLSFIVPDELYEKYEKATTKLPVERESSGEEQPAPKRRGRPPKKVTETEE